jgi:hypothetical protein
VDIAAEIEEILDIVGEEQITGFQLRDIFDENKTLAAVKKKLTQKVAENNLITKGLAKDKQAEKDENEEEDKEKKKEVPQVNIEQLLKSLGLAESIPKLKEHEISELDVFFELTEDKIIELLDIKTEGKKMRFKEKIADIKSKHEKELEKKKLAEEEGMLVDPVGVGTFELLQKKSTICF